MVTTSEKGKHAPTLETPFNLHLSHAAQQFCLRLAPHVIFTSAVYQFIWFPSFIIGLPAFNMCDAYVCPLTLITRKLKGNFRVDLE